VRSIEAALREDKAWQDITTASFLPKDSVIQAEVVFKGERAILCGGKILKQVFQARDRNLKVRVLVAEGSEIRKGTRVARASGKAAGILSAERVALNFLCHLTGIATRVHQFVSLSKKRIMISDTRKTHPLLRDFEKYAVKVGGGAPHRGDLASMAMVKDNHLIAMRRYYGARWSSELAKRTRQIQRRGLEVEIEAQSIKELKEILPAKPDWIMLDNMGGHLKEAIAVIGEYAPKTKIEVSGGVTLEDIPKLSLFPIHRVSMGSLTYGASFADFSLEVL